MYPAGIFSADINAAYDDALYFDSINAKYNLTPHEKSLINANGFMVTERISRNTFGLSFMEIFHQDLPIYVSTDAILHALHMSYDRILKDVELGLLIQQSEAIVNQMHAQIPQLAVRYSSNPVMIERVKDVDVFLTVARKLFNSGAAPYYPYNQSLSNYYYNKAVAATGMNSEFIFAANCRKVDWSQFQPRGHYVDEMHPELADYFRAMMWLGRIELYLMAPKNVYPICLADFYDVQRQTIMTFLLKELYELSGVASQVTSTEEILRFFVGESDNVTMPDLFYLQQALQFTYADALLDSVKMAEFQDTLANQSFAYQKILSQVLYSNPMSPDSIVPASAFLMFGQRFVIDSYVMATVVYDRIKYNGFKICRLFPSTLDPMFAIGNDAAGQLLIPELNEYKYASNLAGLRYLVDSYDQEFWQSSIYNSWLYSIKELNPPSERNNLPPFMQTAAFWQKQLNTQLASWTQLRHDNLLYAKQSYTGGTICSFPYTYIEPFPEFYGALKTLGVNGKTKFQLINFPDPTIKQQVLNYFNDLKNISDTLKSISEKELSGIPYSAGEIDFLQKVIYDTYPGSGIPPYAGWYPRLYYNDPMGEDALFKQNYIVADVHTVPTNCSGGSLGAVVHVGTGPINLGVFIAEVPGNIKVAFIGPVYSYYDYTTLNYQRLTDQDWEATYLLQSLRPNWVNIFLADSSGNSRGPGAQLITAVENQDNFPPEEFLVVKNYPNPFNPSTTISFTVPNNMAFMSTDITIFNIQGEAVRNLFNGELPQGNYLIKWDGKNEAGNQVSSGIYLCKLTIGSNFATSKMTLIK